MSEGENKVDKTIAIVEEKEQKISELEQKLQEYQKQEEEKRKAEEAAKEAELAAKVAETEAKLKAQEESFNKKLEEIQMRQSVVNKETGETKVLTKEEYEKNRVKYDTMYLKHTLPDVFGN